MGLDRQPLPVGSGRPLVLAPPLGGALRRSKAAADAEGTGRPFAFTALNGALLDRNNIRRRHFAEVCKRAEITGRSPHDLRHTMTSHAVVRPRNAGQQKEAAPFLSGGADVNGADPQNRPAA